VKNITGIAAAVVTLALVPRPGFAQSSGRLLAAGAVGYERITDDESFLGSGIGASGSVGWRFTDATSLEVEAGRTRHRRDLGLFAVVRDAQGRTDAIPYTQRWEGTATFVVASVAHAFGSGSVRPVVWGGGGVMTHGGTVRGPVVAPQVPPGFSLQPGDADTRRGSRSNGLVADGGVGVDVRVAPRVTLRPFAGLRLTSTDNVGPKYVVRTGVRVGFQ
jgi:hypothetical protein